MPEIPGLTIRKSNDMQGWGLCIALYGPPGVGKTLRACDLADSEYGRPLAIADAESGSRTISHRNDIDVIEIKRWSDIEKLASYMKRSQDLPWKTVVFDNLSEYNSLCLKQIVGDDTPQIQHYNKSTNAMLNFVRDTRDVSRRTKINIVYIIWDAPEKDEQSGVIKRDVGFTPSLARQFPGIIDMVGYMTAQDSPPYMRKITFAAGSRTAAKIRRSNNENAQKIPLTIEFNTAQQPLVDIVNTIVGGMDWPTLKYVRSSQRSTVSNTNTNTNTEENKE